MSETVSTPGDLIDRFPVDTSSAEETRAFARSLAGGVKQGDVLALYGELGSGKTQFARGLCEALGVSPEEVNSPSFTLINEYTGGGFPIYHMDTYRIDHADEFVDLGVDDYFYGDGVCLVEWPGEIEVLLPRHTIRLYFEHKGGNRRRIEYRP